MIAGPRSAPDLAALFTDAVAFELEGADLEAGGDEGLWPEEEVHVTRAVPARRLQFAAGRRCVPFITGHLLSLAIAPPPDRPRCQPLPTHAGFGGQFTPAAAGRPTIFGRDGKAKRGPLTPPARPAACRHMTH